MNWVGGTRNRLKVKNEKKKQMEFFEKQKYARRMKMYGRQGEQKHTTKPSLDLVSLQMATLTAKQFQNKSSKSKEQRKKVNMEQCVYKNAAQLHRHHNVELPMSPNATPSILQLGDEVKGSQEPQTARNLHNFRRDIQMSMYHSQLNSQGSKHSTHAPSTSFCEQHVSTASREEFSGQTQPLSHIREKFSEDVFFHFPSSSKGSEGRHDDSLPSHPSQSHGVSSAQMSTSSDTSEDSPDKCQDLRVKQDSRKLIHLDSDVDKKLPQYITTTPRTVSRTSYVTTATVQSENSSSSSLENFRRHFRAKDHFEEGCCTPSPLICLDTSAENSPKKSSVGSIDLLCHESTNFTSPESVCDQRLEKRRKCGGGQMLPGTGDGTTGKEILEIDSPSRWLASRNATTDQQLGRKTSLECKSIRAGGVPQEPRNFCGDVPTSDCQHKERFLPVSDERGDLPYEGSSFTRAVLKEVLDLDAELNKHETPDDECRPFKRQKMIPDSLESFSSIVPSVLDKSCKPTETALCEKTKSFLSGKVTPPVSPFTRDVQRRALQSIALLTPVKPMPKLRNMLHLEEKLSVSELSDSDVTAQGESSKTSSGQIPSESQSKISSVITCSKVSRDREIQCQIASVQPSMKEQSTQICSVPNSGLKDVQIQTCSPLQCDASTQYESQVIPGDEVQHVGNVCDSKQSEEILISDDADVPDLKEMGATAASMKPDEESRDEIKGGNYAPAAEGKLIMEHGGRPIELLSQSTCSDSFDSCTSV